LSLLPEHKIYFQTKKHHYGNDWMADRPEEGKSIIRIVNNGVFEGFNQLINGDVKPKKKQ
jgi:hypothetical protein